LPDYSDKKDLAVFKKNNQLVASFWAGVREEYPVEGPKYPSYVLNLNLIHQPTYGRNYGIGLDLMHESYIKRKIERLNPARIATSSDLYRLGAFASYNFVFSRAEVFMHAGCYLYNQLYTPTQYLYERVGMNYSFNKHWKSTVSLKLHYVEADYFAYGIAYVLTLKKKDVK
jgi:hypothetical protein